MRSTPENIKQAIALIEDMKADMGGTALYGPLYEVYNNPPVPGWYRRRFVDLSRAQAIHETSSSSRMARLLVWKWTAL